MPKEEETFESEVGSTQMILYLNSIDRKLSETRSIKDTN